MGERETGTEPLLDADAIGAPRGGRVLLLPRHAMTLAVTFQKTKRLLLLRTTVPGYVRDK